VVPCVRCELRVVGLSKGYCGVGGNGVNVWDGVVIGRWWKLVSKMSGRMSGSWKQEFRCASRWIWNGRHGRRDGNQPLLISHRTLRSGSSS
jgi:hypothetical protein